MEALAMSSPGWSPSIVRAQGRTSEVKSSNNYGRGRTTVVEDIGSWVAKLKYEDLPPEVIKKAKRILLDTLGCALGAVAAGPVRIAQQVVLMQGGKPQATVVGVGWKNSCEQAVFLNGMAIRYLDYNDYVALGSPHHVSI